MWPKGNRLLIVCTCLALLVSLACYWYSRTTLIETGITLEKAGKLKQGMTYEEVVEVIGCKPGTYNEFLKNTNPPLRDGKGREFLLEDADINNASLFTDKYDHVYWRDFNGIQIKVMFTKDTRTVHRIDTYRYVPEENAFRYAKPILEATFSPKPTEAITEDEAVKIAFAHLKSNLSDHKDCKITARLDDFNKVWSILIVYDPTLPGEHVLVTVDSVTKQVTNVVGGK